MRKDDDGRPNWDKSTEMIKINAKGMPQIIIDAESHRRTPWMPAVWAKAIQCETLLEAGETGTNNWPQKEIENITNTPQWFANIS